MELLVRWWSLGEGGTSGTLQCVVKEPASEHEPRTELYVAHTLRSSKQEVGQKKKKIQPETNEERTASFLTGRGSPTPASGLSGGTPTLLR